MDSSSASTSTTAARSCTRIAVDSQEGSEGPISGNDGAVTDQHQPSNGDHFPSSETPTSHITSTAFDERLDPWKNRNVRLCLAQCLMQGVADSIWSSVVLSAFLYSMADTAMHQKTNDNALVGVAGAVQGVAQLVSALPVGIVADVYGKAKVVAAGGGLMLVTIALSLWAVSSVMHNQDSVEDATRSYYWLVAALGLWGIVGGVSSGTTQALFADSIAKGNRSELYTWLQTTYLMASTAGPIVGIVLLLQFHGEAESWSLQKLYPVFVAGLSLEIPGAIAMFFYSDEHVVEDESDHDGQQRQVAPENVNDGLETPLVQPPEQETIVSTNNSAVTNTAHGSRAGDRSCLSKWGKASIPYILFLSSLVVSLGSGASVKYFPLFFKELGFHSAFVQGIYAVVAVFISGFSFVATSLSKRLGRIETTVLLDFIGISLLVYMTWLSRDVENLSHAKTYLIVAVYLFRTGIMNSTYPLLESVLMDNIPSNKRARWKSLESISAFGWTGSALLGGILADEHSYRFTFLITAFLQLTGAILLIPIQPFVESEESEVHHRAANEEAPSSTNSNDLTEPLLVEN